MRSMVEGRREAAMLHRRLAPPPPPHFVRSPSPGNSGEDMVEPAHPSFLSVSTWSTS